jgi:hypothetical protein
MRKKATRFKGRPPAAIAFWPRSSFFRAALAFLRAAFLRRVSRLLRPLASQRHRQSSAAKSADVQPGCSPSGCRSPKNLVFESQRGGLGLFAIHRSGSVDNARVGDAAPPVMSAAQLRATSEWQWTLCQRDRRVS